MRRNMKKLVKRFICVFLAIILNYTVLSYISYGAEEYGFTTDGFYEELGENDIEAEKSHDVDEDWLYLFQMFDKLDEDINHAFVGIMPMSAPIPSGNIDQRMQQLRNIFPHNSYFSVNRRACTHGQAFGCNNCRIQNVTSSLGHTNNPFSWEAWTCVAFARYAFWFLTGVAINQAAYPATPTAPPGTHLVPLNNLRAGDYVVYNSGGVRHHAIFVGRSGNQNLYFHSNVNAANRVQFNTRTWSGTPQFAFRTNNPPGATPPPPPPPPPGSISHSNVRATSITHNNVFVIGTIHNPNRRRVSPVGVVIWDDYGNEVVSHWETTNLSVSTITQTFNVLGYGFRPLISGRRYHWMMWADDAVTGRRYYSAAQTFRTLDNIPPVISNVRVTDVNQFGYTVRATVTDNVGVTRVQFPTWIPRYGQSHLVPNWQTNPAVAGVRDGNEFSFRVNIANYGNHRGVFQTHIYAWDAAGNRVAHGNLQVTVPNTTTVTFDANGGSVTPRTRQFTIGNNYGTLPVPTRSGHTFNGWFTARTGGSQVRANTRVTNASNHTLFARWTVNQPNQPPPPPPPPTQTQQTIPLWRMFNPSLNQHLWTTCSNEYRLLATRGWRQEGIAWHTPRTGRPVHRLFHPGIIRHHYTADQNEIRVLRGRGWNDEGVIFFCASPNVRPGEGIRMTRLFHPGSLKHLHTADANEIRILTTQHGWRYEGFSFVGLPLR